jgi:hypothetical protein
MELALEAAPVRDAEQVIGIGGGLKFLDLRLGPGQFGLEPANRCLGAVGDGRRPGPACGLPPWSGFSPGSRTFGAFSSPSGGRPGLFLDGLPCAGSLIKACRDSPRQDSPFLIPCHALDEPRADPIIGLCFWIPEQN